MKLYCIKQDDTDLYYCDGKWCEEPEWFSHTEAIMLIRRINDPSPLSIDSYEFSGSDIE